MKQATNNTYSKALRVSNQILWNCCSSLSIVVYMEQNIYSNTTLHWGNRMKSARVIWRLKRMAEAAFDNLWIVSLSWSSACVSQYSLASSLKFRRATICQARIIILYREFLLLPSALFSNPSEAISYIYIFAILPWMQNGSSSSRRFYTHLRETMFFHFPI